MRILVLRCGIDGGAAALPEGYGGADVREFGVVPSRKDRLPGGRGGGGAPHDDQPTPDEIRRRSLTWANPGSGARPVSGCGGGGPGTLVPRVVAHLMRGTSGFGWRTCRRRLPPELGVHNGVDVRGPGAGGSVPLIRDDTGQAIVGFALLTERHRRHLQPRRPARRSVGRHRKLFSGTHGCRCGHPDAPAWSPRAAAVNDGARRWFRKL